MLIIKLILINLFFVLGFLVLLPESPWLFSINTLCTVLLLVFQVSRANQQYQQTYHALHNGLRNLQDGDFAISLAVPKEQTNNQQQVQLLTLFNQVTEKLRDDKQSLYQRELLLDKVVNASDVITVLVNHRDTIIFANRAAQHFFSSYALLGQQWPTLISENMPELLEHNDKTNAIIQLFIDDNTSASATTNANQKTKSEHSWHLSRHQLKLHGTCHQLTLLKPLTKELHKQELQTWKKVIRVINHELNNSIAPISTMCHSGLILADKLNDTQLNRVFNTISGRIKRLSEFINNYSQLARLSTPIYQHFDLITLLEQLQNLYHFEIQCQQKTVDISADASQIEQLLINLLKNAKEFSPIKATQVTIEQLRASYVITIRDFGPGMSQSVMQKAFLPYYSTKDTGSGIGLSICREIVEAHHGQISLNNHKEVGLQVSINMPINKQN